MEIDDQRNEEKWITFEDGAFISKRNWIIREWTRIGIICGMFIGFMLFWNVTVLNLVSQSHNIILESAILDDLQTGSLYFSYLGGFLVLAFFSFVIARHYGNKLFAKYMNDFLVHYKEDWMRK